jgi:hypothetical protein
LRRRGYGCNPHRSKLQNRTKFTPKKLPEENRNLKRFDTCSRQLSVGLSQLRSPVIRLG